MGMMTDALAPVHFSVRFSQDWHVQAFPNLATRFTTGEAIPYCRPNWASRGLLGLAPFSPRGVKGHTSGN